MTYPDGRGINGGRGVTGPTGQMCPGAVGRDWDESQHPRGQPDNAGQFGPGGGGHEDASHEGGGKKPGKGKAPKSGKGEAGAASQEGQHPGPGYSNEARLQHDGSIYTTNVYDAVLALYEHKHVELDQPRSVSTLIRKLGEEAQRWEKQGQHAPTFNLCDVTVEGTNLFCADTKGIPRIKMPQLDRGQTKEFLKYLKEQGYEVEKHRERADFLRATQDELSGAKVAANMVKLKNEDDHIGRRLVVSRDNYILDGHHHWAAKIGLDAKEGELSQATKVPVSRVDISITQLLREAEKFTGGKGHKSAEERAYVPDAPKIRIELWPQNDESEDGFLDRCMLRLTACIGPERAAEVCGDKWDVSAELGRGVVTRDMLRGELADNLALEPCGTCVACNPPSHIVRFAPDFRHGVFVRAHLDHDSAEAIYAWAQTLKLPDGASLVDPNEYHATLIYSKTPFDYVLDNDDKTYPSDDSTRKHLEVLGKDDDDKVLTLRFESHDLAKRFAALQAQGGVSDFPTYKPHVTIAEGVSADHDVSQHKVYTGRILFTSESAEPIDPDRQKSACNGAPARPDKDRHGHENDQRYQRVARGSEAAVGRIDAARARDRGQYLGKSSGHDGGRVHRALPGNGALARDWDEDKHPREPAGTPEGGRFAGGGAAEGGDGGESKTATVAHSTKDHQRFHAAISAAKASTRFGASVHVYEPDEYRSMRLYLSGDGKAGFALKGDDIVSAFKHADSKIEDFAGKALRQAVALGGRRLDAFDTVLPTLYSQAGFRAVARLAWSDQYAPPGWDKKTFEHFNGGEPDVVFMVHDPSYGKLYQPGDGKRVESYDEGIAEQEHALAAFRKKDWDEAKHPREPSGTPEGGRFAGGGAAEGGESKEPGAPKSVKLDPEVINVGGDEYNRETAARLESEYQRAKPAIEKLANDAVGAETERPQDTEDEDEEEEPYIPEEWDMLSASAQSEAEEKYVEWAKSDAISSESDYYYSEYAPHDAREQIAEQFNDGSEREWAEDALEEARHPEDEGGPLEPKLPDFPFTQAQILAALTINFEGNPGGSLHDPEFEWNDEYLDELKAPSKEQLRLPGIEAEEGHKLLTDDMREQIEKVIAKAFDKEGDDKAGNMDVPEWVEENAKESLSESWSSMDDSDKFEWVQAHTNIVEDESTGVPEKQSPVATVEEVDALPDKYDPLNSTSGTDYQRTQRLARYLSVERAMEVIKQRGLAETLPPKGEPEPIPDSQLRRDVTALDNKLWSAWKSSSTTNNGMLLQLATAAELGGRLNTEHFPEKPEAIREMANRHYENVGGWEGIKAYVRAKWEVTQYLLDKAGIKTLDLYRGIGIDQEKFDRFFALSRRVRAYAQAQEVHPQDGSPGTWRYLPTLEVVRNGAASTTTDRDVANGWSGGRGTKITLRAEVPRTAAVSVPAYGVNIHSEHEVVVAGTAWRGWDAWSGNAPPFDDVPLRQAA